MADWGGKSDEDVSDSSIVIPCKAVRSYLGVETPVKNNVAPSQPQCKLANASDHSEHEDSSAYNFFTSGKRMLSLF